MRLARERQRAVGAIEPGSSRQRACSVPVDAEEALLGKVIRRSLTMAGFDARRLRRKNAKAAHHTQEQQSRATPSASEMMDCCAAGHNGNGSSTKWCLALHIVFFISS